MGKCKDGECTIIKQNMCCGECDKVSICGLRCTFIYHGMKVAELEDCEDYINELEEE